MDAHHPSGALKAPSSSNITAKGPPNAPRQPNSQPSTGTATNEKPIRESGSKPPSRKNASTSKQPKQTPHPNSCLNSNSTNPAYDAPCEFRLDENGREILVLLEGGDGHGAVHGDDGDGPQPQSQPTATTATSRLSATIVAAIEAIEKERQVECDAAKELCEVGTRRSRVYW